MVVPLRIVVDGDRILIRTPAGTVGSERGRTKAPGSGLVRDRTLGVTNGGVVMIRLFRRKSTTTEPATEPTVPVSEVQTVDVAEGSMTAEDLHPGARR